MNYACITDTHIDENNFSLIEDLFDQLINECQRKNIGVVLHFGDWFKSRKGQSQAALLSTMRIIDNLRRNNITLIIIPGNHDKTDLDANESFLDVFNCDCFKVLPTAHIIDNGKTILGFLPFYKEEKYASELRKLISNIDEFGDEDAKRYLITHQGISGVKNNDGSSVDNSLTESLFESFELVLVGHYHNVQRYSNIYYIGSSHCANFGEDNDKGFVILNTETGETERIVLNFPKFTKLSIDIERLEIKDINDLILSKQETGNNIRLIITGTSESLKTFDRTLLIDNGIDVKLEANEISHALDVAKDNEYEVFNVESIQNEFDVFCKERGFDAKKGKKYLNVLNT